MHFRIRRRNHSHQHDNGKMVLFRATTPSLSLLTKRSKPLSLPLNIHACCRPVLLLLSKSNKYRTSISAGWNKSTSTTTTTTTPIPKSIVLAIYWISSSSIGSNSRIVRRKTSTSSSSSSSSSRRATNTIPQSILSIC